MERHIGAFQLEAYAHGMSHTELDVLRRAVADTVSDPAAQLHVNPDRLPPSCPVPLPPLEGFTLLGSVSSRSLMDHFSASVFLKTTSSLEDARRQLGEALLEAGWAGQWHAFFSRAGFVDPEQGQLEPPPRSDPPHFFVHHDSRCVAFIQEQVGIGSTGLTLRLETGHSYEHHVRQREDPSAALPLPLPSGMTVQTLGGGAAASSVALHARTAALLSGTATTAQLQQHFGGELTRQGWSRGEEAGSETLWSSRWQRTPASGGWLGTLMLTLLEDGEWQAQFDVLQRRPRQDGNAGWSSFTI